MHRTFPLTALPTSTDIYVFDVGHGRSKHVIEGNAEGWYYDPNNQ